MRARKRFGQNFLNDQLTIQRIIDAIRPSASDHILEIGPGHGALTKNLVASGCQLDVVEIDRDLAAELRQRYPGLNVIEADILKFDFNQIRGDRPLRVVGNLPYNISTPLLFMLFEKLDMIEDMYFMLQLEVVERMAAAASTSQYGRLSIMSQYFCAAEKLFDVPPSAFTPAPKVDSAVVHLAGALGLPAWLLLKAIPEWRWALQSDRSYWYDSLRLFRQISPGSWQEPLQQICRALASFNPPPDAASRMD